MGGIAWEVGGGVTTGSGGWGGGFADGGGVGGFVGLGGGFGGVVRSTHCLLFCLLDILVIDVAAIQIGDLRY